jgi:hypothetical protein
VPTTVTLGFLALAEATASVYATLSMLVRFSTPSTLTDVESF